MSRDAQCEINNKLISNQSFVLQVKEEILKGKIFGE